MEMVDVESGERRYAEDVSRKIPSEKRTLLSRCMQERNTGIFCGAPWSNAKEAIIVVY